MAATFKRIFRQDLTKPLQIYYNLELVFSKDNLANEIQIELYNGSDVYSGGGSVSGTAIRADGRTVPLENGTISGNVVTVALTEACMEIPGTLQVYVKLTSGNVKTTIFAGVFTAIRTETGTVIDPGTIIPSITELINQIDAAIDSIPADYSTLLGSVAGTYSASKTYAVGDYAWYNGSLYRCTTAISTAEAWTSGHWTAAVLSDDLSGLKSAINKKINSFIEYDDDAFSMANYYFNKNTGYANPTTGDLFYVTSYIAIPEEVSKIHVKLYQNVNLVAPVVFYTAIDASAVDSFIVSINGTDTGIVEGHIDIPATAKYVRFGLRDKSVEQYAQFIYDGLTEKLISLENTAIYNAFGNSETGTISQKFLTEAFDNTIPENHRISNFPNLGYIKPNGTIQADTSGSWGYTDLIQIPNGLKKISVKLYYNPSAIAVCAFYNNAGTRIQAVATITGATSGTVYIGDIPVPDGAYYFRATKRTADGEQYAEFTYNYDEIMTDAMDEATCILAETLAKPFVLSGANAIGFGDSIMYGYRSLDASDVSSNPWPNIVKDRFGFNNFTNRAVGGAGFTVGTTIITQMTGQTLGTRNYIFIAAGTNDYHYAATTENFKTAVDTAFDYIDENKGENTKVVVITPINRSQAPGNTNGASLNVYRSILTESALKRGYSVIDGRKFGFPDFAGDYQEAILPDGLHPNDAGYVMYANHICGLLG